MRGCALAAVAVVALLVGVASPSVASASVAEPCSNEQLRVEQPFASGLPDCRAYEIVSPLGKDDNGVSYIGSRAAVSGEGLVYASIGAFAEPRSAGLEDTYLSRRAVGGWSTRNISPPYTAYGGLSSSNPVFAELLFTPDLSSGIVESQNTPLVSGQPVGYTNLYVADTQTGSYQTVTPVTPEAEYEPFLEQQAGEMPQAEGASTGLGRVVFQQGASLCCGAAPGKTEHHVYEWAGGRLALVDVPPPGVELGSEVNVGSYANFNQPAVFGDPWRAVSADGSRVIFTGGTGEASGELIKQVFVRENPMSVVEDCSVAGGACTVEVSASQRSVPDPSALKAPSAWYRGASVDGSRVFFVSRVELTNDAYTGPEDNAANLYEYDFTKPEGERLSDLTVDSTDPDGAGVLGLVTASEDGSYVYFVAAGKLSGEANGEGEEAVAGKPNLYLSHAGKVTFIATLAPTRIGFFHKEGRNENGDEEDWVGEEGTNHDYGPGSHTARVTPDGTGLAFESERPLTKYDNEPVEPADCTETEGVELSGSNPSIPCREVYLYDAVSGKLICASCNPDGSRPVGPAELGGHEIEGLSASSLYPYYLSNNLSVGGGRLFFQSPDGLVPHDSNGLVDVYEWERVGEGSCTSASASFTASHDGCTFPISDVASGSESHFMDASVSGNDVFIATGAQLTSSDTDTREDVYDVRVGGGFPVSTPPSECDNADSCKPPVSPQPGVFGVPASATFFGPGNATPAVNPAPPVVVKPKTKTVKCAKNKKLSHGKCVRKKRPKAKRSAHTSRGAGS